MSRRPLFLWRSPSIVAACRCDREPRRRRQILPERWAVSGDHSSSDYAEIEHQEDHRARLVHADWSERRSRSRRCELVSQVAVSEADPNSVRSTAVLRSCCRRRATSQATRDTSPTAYRVDRQLRETQMPPKGPPPRTGRQPAQRVAAPPTQTKTKRLSPAYALAWLHLMPDSAFPIRSRDDMATKISALLFTRPTSEAQGAGHGLPVGAQQKPGERKRAR